MPMRDLDVVIESLRFLSQTGEVAPPSPAPTAEQVEEVTRMLGHPLPPTYVEFMRRAGEIMPEGFDLYWVGPPEMSRRHIAVANDVERSDPDAPLPDCLIAFFEDEDGDQYCFDTRPPDQAGGRPVMDAEPDASAIYAMTGEDPTDRVDRDDLEPGEYPVVVWDREKGCEQINECLYVAGDDFVDWLKLYLKEQF